jgi:hypothetical protein
MTHPLRMPGHVGRCLIALFLLGVLAQARAALPMNDAEPALSSPLGVFYYPGWKKGVEGLPAGYPDPWSRIRAFPEREPLLGWYAEGEPDVMAQHLEWMHAHGIGFVVFDWYWGNGREYLGHAVEAYHRVEGRHRTPYALMWANHSRSLQSGADFYAMVRHLLEKHVKRPEYLKFKGRPVLFIMVPDQLERSASALNVSAAQMLERAQAMARASGLPQGLIFIAGAGAGSPVTKGPDAARGYDGFFAYNYHEGPGGLIGTERRMSRSFKELDDGYRGHWRHFQNSASLPYVVTLTAGWDKRPWGGSQDPLHDNSVPTDAEFLAHLKAGKAAMQAQAAKGGGLGLLCCWNEFGEGSIVEPTKQRGTKTLEIVRQVFGR